MADNSKLSTVLILIATAMVVGVIIGYLEGDIKYGLILGGGFSIGGAVFHAIRTYVL